jgi:thioredoxin:protein disulfide reductase
VKIFIATLLALIFSAQTFAATYTQETLPPVIKRAVMWDALLKENHFRSDLEGRSHGHVIIEIQIETRNDFNVYRENLKFRADQDAMLGPNKNWKIEILKEPQKHRFLDPVTRSMKEGFRGQSVFEVKYSLPPEGAQNVSNEHKIPVLIDFQACNKELCLLPATLLIEVPLVQTTTRRLDPHANVFQKSWIETQADKLSALLDGDSFSLMTFLLLFIAGLITAFTPCVYPLYPLTIGIFSRWTTHSTSKTFILSLVYCAGMTLSYALLGLITASSGLLFGSMTQNPLFLLSIGLMILLSALFFSGIIPFQAPQFLQNIFMGAEGELKKQHSLKQLAPKAGFMGLGLGVVAAPCVGPVILALMAWLSTRFASGEASHLLGFLLLACFGAGMSFPFLLMGHLMLRMKSKARWGAITPYFKHAGTFFMIVGSLFFIVPALQGLGFWSSRHVETRFEVHSLDTWPQDKWSVIDFRADWCAACLELENQTFTHPHVSPFFESQEWDFVSVDLTHNTPENQALARQWNVIGLPTVLIVSPEGIPCSAITLNGFEPADQFAARMAQGPLQCPNRDGGLKDDKTN